MFARKYLMFFFIFFIGIGSAFANIENNVVKIKSFKYDEMNSGFYGYGEGSAVLIGGNKAITNAHVIVDGEDKASLYYEVCITESFSKEPKCDYKGTVLNYDVKKDLALIEITPLDEKTKVIDSPQVTYYTGDLNLGDDVSVYGYPGVGGKTITFTQGKISGSENEMYKTDTKIDAGNSGGGAFNKNGQLVGIPTSITEDYDTMGWIIKASTVKDFLTTTGIKQVLQTNYKDFLSYINLLNSVNNDKNFDLNIGNNLVINNLSTYYNLNNYEDYKYGSIVSLENKDNDDIVVKINRMTLYNSPQDKTIISKNLISDIKKLTGVGVKCTKGGLTSVCMDENSILIMFIKGDNLYSVSIYNYGNGKNIASENKAEARKLIKQVLTLNNNPSNISSNLVLGKIGLKQTSNYYYIGVVSDYDTKIDIDDINTGTFGNIGYRKMQEGQNKDTIISGLKEMYDSLELKSDKITINKINLDIFYYKKYGTMSVVYFGNDGYRYTITFQFRENTEFNTAKEQITNFLNKALLIQ